MFPLGGITKAQVRREAAERGLAVADKVDSTDICFIASGDTSGWLREKLGAQPGSVVDVDGAVVGRHEGAYAFTVGQRKGLALDRPAADGRPRYVLGISPVENTVTVGPAEALDVTRLHAAESTYSGPPVDCLAQIRAHGAAVPATAEGDGDSLTVTLHQPVRGMAPGQAVVLYGRDTSGDPADERVLGGGRVVSAA
jgi:tRNA-specific 2-thiouridylase